MVVVRRAFFVVVLSLAVVGAISLLRGTGSRLTAQHTGGQWVAPDNPSDELVNGA
jgi:hypothetical protein